VTDLDRYAGFHVPRETIEKVEAFARLLLEENARQNLIASSTAPRVWERHVHDAAQLVRLAPAEARWLDIGSGGGLPGMVLALLTAAPMTLVEPRRLRADFLQRCSEALELPNVTVASVKVQAVRGRFDVITARAVAPLSSLFAWAHHLSQAETCWILPKGRSGTNELAEAERSWQGRFRIEPSMTEDGAVIIVGSHVRRRKGRG
jgi:16S rRNA (guanine527-N7)-methyltransferase